MLKCNTDKINFPTERTIIEGLIKLYDDRGIWCMGVEVLNREIGEEELMKGWEN